MSNGRRGTAAAARSGQRLRAAARRARLFANLPEAPVNALGEAAGELWYRARAGTGRTGAAQLPAGDRLPGRPRPRQRVDPAAATDPAALERLVRRAFRQAMRYYLDMMRLPGRSPAELDRRLVVETPDTVEDAFGQPGQKVFVSMHFGAVEFPALFAVARTGAPVTAPMETLPTRSSRSGSGAPARRWASTSCRCATLGGP